MPSGIWDWTYGFALFSLGVLFEKLRASGERTLLAGSSSKPIKTVESADEFDTTEYVELVDDVEIESTQPHLGRSTSMIVHESKSAIPSVKIRVYQEHQKIGNEKPRNNANSQVRRITQRHNPPETNR